MDHQDIDAAVAEMLRVLGPRTAEDWTVAAGPLEWTCWQTAAHIGHDLLAYAGQLAAQPADAYLPIDLTVRPTATPAEVLQTVTACGRLLGSALATADPGLRAWHWGPCDPSGFAAMGVAEILLHTHDITRGLAVDWLPPAPLSAAVLDRLFPTAPDGDPPQVLLWCTGRGELDGLPRRTSWRWEAARQD
ncbi:maleylpyruvate isomerase N-terminal domain-containing protein [Streptomyces avicenniae]|uniref:maleylpyruvate isomerase N-terminal domain-containing protein n=1 Tax=Streptomyces avicenniae TaxID=500153 RepID=UPI00069CA846|nr:maleylpyruvate isomerase N-terminal domain-containing protein [Streptomyces avicenniae]